MLNVVRKTLFTSLSYMGSHQRDGGTMEGIGQKQQKTAKPGKSHPARCESLQWAIGFATQDKDVVEALVLEAGHCRPGSGHIAIATESNPVDQAQILYRSYFQIGMIPLFP
jgi:hypothetical protein